MVPGELSVSVTRLKGAGPAAVRDLAKLGISTVAQLLMHLPREHANRRDEVSLLEGLSRHQPANTVVTVAAHSFFGPPHRQTLKLHVIDRQGTPAELPCFNRPFLAKSWPVGAHAWLNGLPESKYSSLQIASFDLDLPPAGYLPGAPLGEAGNLVPHYPLAGSLNHTGVGRLVKQALADFAKERFDDELPESFRRRHALTDLDTALRQVHFPPSLERLEAARRTLVWRELFHLQTAILRRSLAATAPSRPPIRLPARLRREFLARLEFDLTTDQVKVLEEIDSDLTAPVPMARLLQGDVGSGKTLVAFLTALPLIEAGFQCALMAPTELLALQHAENAARVLDPLGVKIAFLSGNLKAAGRNALLDQLAEGKIDFVVGTHALFSDPVAFKNLRAVIIDEQHRFGVLQRQALLRKGEVVDLLLMSATPIPRTLALTAFGDLKTSVIRTMPHGRKPIVTHTNKMANQQKVYDFVRAELQAGHQAYFVYPLIEASEALDLKDAQSMAAQLSEVFAGYRVGLIHSRLPEDEKKAVMEEFSRGVAAVLVATSVVEVGVDVANATCMVIEHAERFGLSALHQLRGRVGRSSLQSYCFLVYGDTLTDDGKTRLRVMMETTDGFRVAEEDLKLRGPGDIAGAKQSGFLKLAAADLGRDLEILVICREELQTLLADDPQLERPEHAGMKRLWTNAPPFSDELVAL
ncbi:MAG: ATP-dependent DNA helicase RecG [Spirochaetales bacterium]